LTTLADHKHDRNLWLRNLIQVAHHYDDDLDENRLETIRQARQGLAPEPIAWDWAKPGDPGVHILLRYIASKKQQREQMRAAAKNSAPPSDGFERRAGDQCD
jgi:hypothetical protein